MASFAERPSMPSGGDYDRFVEGVLRHTIGYIESKHPFFTFIDAFKDVSPYIQRDVNGGQQVLDPQRRLNIELQEKVVIIYVPDPNTEQVSLSAAAVLGAILQVEPTLERPGDTQALTNLFEMKARTPGKIYSYWMRCYSHDVPSPDGNNNQVQGTHIALLFEASLPL